MRIREISYEELEEASALLWKSFYQAEKKNHSMAGMEKFRDLTSAVSLSINTFDGSVLLYGLFSDGEMCAVGALRDKKHVLLLYVHPQKQKMGYGKKLLRYMEALCKGDRITLNSSDSAVSFYERMGYRVTSSRKVEKEMIFTPMMKERELNND